MIKDITKILQKTESNLIKNLVASGAIVLGVKIKNKAKLLIDDVKFSDTLQLEISKKAKIGGFISTDELPHYGISKAEKKAIEKEFSCGKKDVVVFVAAEKSKAEKAIELISEEMEKKEIKIKKPAKINKIKKVGQKTVKIKKIKSKSKK
ncbi:MAG: hypothetical protein PHE88_07305 [Elusimicrobia bacterium]|nr:hypothetical protein [Elusimicrobiota bacterium]